jgi:hypothetical protein
VVPVRCAWPWTASTPYRMGIPSRVCRGSLLVALYHLVPVLGVVLPAGIAAAAGQHAAEQPSVTSAGLRSVQPLLGTDSRSATSGRLVESHLASSAATVLHREEAFSQALSPSRWWWARRPVALALGDELLHAATTRPARAARFRSIRPRRRAASSNASGVSPSSRVAPIVAGLAQTRLGPIRPSCPDEPTADAVRSERIRGEREAPGRAHLVNSSMRRSIRQGPGRPSSR